MERLFASTEPLDADFDRVLICQDHYARPQAERILPDGAHHLIFNLGERRGEPLCFVTGATCRPARIVLDGAIDQVCVRLRVGTAAVLLGRPAAEVTDQDVSLEDLWGRSAVELADQLHSTAPAARAARMTAFLTDRLRRADPPPRTARQAVRRIAATGGRLKVSDLAKDLGVTDRRLQQLFHEQVGLTPKALCRLERFRTALRRWRGNTDRTWAELALDGGFYDQAHLVNELKTFTGLTPTQLSGFGFFQETEAHPAA